MGEERLTIEMQQQFSYQMLDRQAIIDQSMLQMQQAFQSNQAQLDRAVVQGNLEEARRSAMAQEEMQRAQFELERQQFKMGLFQSLASEPQMLFFLRQSGNLGQFAEVLGEEASENLEQMLDRIAARPSANVQQFARMSSEEQAQEQFAQGANFGYQNVSGALQGAGPLAAINRPSQQGNISAGSQGRFG